MGIPYCEVRWGTRLGVRGPWGPSRLALGLGNEARERENPRGWDFPHPCNRWMQCGLACGCQSSKATGEAHARARLFVGEVQGGPPQMGCLFPPGFRHQIVRRVQRTRVTWAVRSEKGNVLEGRQEGDWLLRRASVLPF